MNTPTVQFPRFFLPLLRVILPLLLVACVSIPPPKNSATAKTESTNASRHAYFRTTETWKRRIFRDESVLALADAKNLRVQIVLGEQRGFLFVGDQIGYDFPISSGKKGHETPQGNFKIIAKELNHRSNLYGQILDSEGNVTIANADMKQHKVSDGDRFEGAAMPYFMRLTNDGVGLHIGANPGYAASHGCVRLPNRVAPKIYELAPIGTPVSITETLTPLVPNPLKPVKAS